jgi:septal ring factor EnvC (AmiA/AmiB activator)
MNGELWAGIAGALLTLIAAALALPKVRAEARKATAEANRTEWQTLRDEIDRQNKQIVGLRDEVHKLRTKMASREGELERENKVLHTEVARLTRRVEGLEAILKIVPVPPEMQALLDELDRKTAGGKA